MKTFKDTKYGNLTGQFYEGNINVVGMNLDSLEGAPKKVYGYFFCEKNNLKNLNSGPDIVRGNFSCSSNKKLESLEGAPEVVNGIFHCLDCPKLKSLKGAPKIVEGSFYCTECPLLTSLDELLDTEIKGKLYSDIMTDEEFKELQDLYNKAGKNMKKYELLKKLKEIK